MDRRRFLLAATGVGALSLPAGINPSLVEDTTSIPREPLTPRPPAPGGLVDISITSAPVTVAMDGQLEIGYRLTYDGDTTVPVEVRLQVDDRTVETETRTVGQDAVTGSMVWIPGSIDAPPDPGETVVRIAVDGASDEVTISFEDLSIERAGIEFDRILNGVDDLGFDPTGVEPVAADLTDVRSGDLIQLPAGQYRMIDPIRLRGTHIGIEAIDDAEVDLVIDSGANDWILDADGDATVYLEGVDIDQTATEANGCLRLVGDRIHIENVEFVGRADVWETGAQNMLHCAIEDPDGYGEVRNVVHTEGHWARYGPSATGRIGIYTGARHRGTLKIVDCDLREFGNNALYCSRNYGAVQVEDSYFENNNAAQIRIGGEGSYAENCTIVTDPASYSGPRTYEGQSFQHRGIVIEEHFTTGGIQHQKEAGAEIRNCTIRIEDNPANGAAIHRYGNGRSLRIEDTTIEYNNDGYVAAILVSADGPGQNPPGDPPRHIEFVDSEIVGTGEVDTVISLEGADGSALVDSTIELQSLDGDGITVEDSSGVEVRNVDISVPGEAVVADPEDVAIMNLD